jgi:hypothetical protein
MVADEFEDDVPPPPPPVEEGLDAFVRRNPTTSVVGALIAGILLGRLGIL